jgi:hypothetical protein
VAVAWAAVGWCGRRPWRLVAAGRVVLALLRRPGAATGGWLGMAACPMRDERVVGAGRAAQQRNGRVRSRANARASWVAHGQERCSRRMTRRAWWTMRPAVWSSR